MRSVESGEVIIPDVRTVTISPDSVTDHMAAGGFRPADVEQIMTEVAKFLDEVMQKRRTR